MKRLALYVLAAAVLGGCGIEEGVRRNDDRYLRPGALDLPLTSVFDTYQFRFLDKYRVTHQWPHTAGTCDYRKVSRDDASGGRFFSVRDIYELDGKTWQRFENTTPFNFDPYVRSVRFVSKEWGSEGVEKDRGFQAVCFASWWVTSHLLRASLHKRDLATWQAILSETNPSGRWSERRVGSNLWLVQDTAAEHFRSRPLNGVGGPFQSWLLPIGATGYTIGMELRASQESLQYPEAHARFKAAFQHLIESVRIEPLQ